MKIAVLLRGQMRFSQEGAHLFKKFVIDKYPQHEFEFFVSTSARVQHLNQTLPQFNSENLTLPLVKKLISHWPGVRQWSLQTEQELFNTIKKIVIQLAQDQKLYDWFNHYNKIHSAGDEFFNFSIPPLTGVPVGDYKPDFSYDTASIFYNSLADNNQIFDKTGDLANIIELCEKISSESELYHNIELKNYAIDLHNYICQYYSFVRSFKVLKDYMSINVDYKPDLVWSTRSDVFHLFSGYNCTKKFDQLRDQLEYLHDDKVSDKKAIISNSVLIDRNQPYVCDLNFFSTVDMLDNILNLESQSSEDLIFNALTRNKINLIKTRDAKDAIHHILWAAIFSDACFQQADGTTAHYSAVIRHTFSSEDILKMTGSADDESVLKTMVKEFKYPIRAGEVKPPDVIREFDYLSSN